MHVADFDDSNIIEDGEEGVPPEPPAGVEGSQSFADMSITDDLPEHSAPSPEEEQEVPTAPIGLQRFWSLSLCKPPLNSAPHKLCVLDYFSFLSGIQNNKDELESRS